MPFPTLKVHAVKPHSFKLQDQYRNLSGWLFKRYPPSLYSPTLALADNPHQNKLISSPPSKLLQLAALISAQKQQVQTLRIQFPSYSYFWETPSCSPSSPDDIHLLEESAIQDYFITILNSFCSKAYRYGNLCLSKQAALTKIIPCCHLYHPSLCKGRKSVICLTYMDPGLRSRLQLCWQQKMMSDIPVNKLYYCHQSSSNLSLDALGYYRMLTDFSIERVSFHDSAIFYEDAAQPFFFFWAH